MQQTIVQGINQLPNILHSLQCERLFLVSDASYSYLNIAPIINSIQIPKVIFSDFTPNPLYEQIAKGISLLKQERCNCILAVGGGSAIDVAKCIKLAISAKEGNNALLPPLVNNRVAIYDKGIPLIAIPTTAGTGSESTHNAVMYYQNTKQTVTNDHILPNYALLEPTVLSTLPLYQKKCTLMDAFCQGIESWWSINSTPESYDYSRQAIRIITQHWHDYIFNPTIETAEKIMLAANFSGRAINITATTAAHAMSYKLTSLYHLPHGHAVAICLPEIWEYMYQHIEQCCDSRGSDYLCSVFLQIAQTMGVANVKEAIYMFRQMMSSMELNRPISVNREQELAILSSSVNPVRLKNNPIELDNETIYKIYDSILK